MPDYQKEAKERWGGTPEWAQSQARASTMTDADWQRVTQGQADFAAELADAKAAGVEPGSEAARVIVDKHLALISQWYECTRARQLILARMYTQDQRFSAAYGGNEAYLLELVEAQAALEGITEPSWND